MDNETQEAVRNLLFGSSCVETGDHGSFLYLNFGTCGLTIGAAWRLVHEGKIVVGSGTPDDTIDSLTTAFLGRTVERVAVHGTFHDLHIAFDEGFILEVFAESNWYESWNLTRSTVMIGAGPSDSWWRFDIPDDHTDGSTSSRSGG